MKNYSIRSLVFGLMFVSCGAMAQTNEHDCLNLLPASFRANLTDPTSKLYVGAWPAADGLCQGLLIKEVSNGEVSVVYAYGPTPKRPSGELSTKARLTGGELSFTLPWQAQVKYQLAEGRAFYTDKTGTYEGYISLRNP